MQLQVDAGSRLPTVRLRKCGNIGDRLSGFLQVAKAMGLRTCKASFLIFLCFGLHEQGDPEQEENGLGRQSGLRGASPVSCKVPETITAASDSRNRGLLSIRPSPCAAPAIGWEESKVEFGGLGRIF